MNKSLLPILLVATGFLAFTLFLNFIGSFNPEKTALTTPKTSKAALKSSKDSVAFDKEANTIAQLLAAMPISDTNQTKMAENPIVKSHNQEFNKGWKSLETNKLQKMRVWRDEELSNFNRTSHNLFYPFSGPDFLNAYELFPNCENYVLIGLEKVGELPKLSDLKGTYLQNYLANTRLALSEIFQRNYFITVRMSGAFNTNLKGILPILAVFLARTDNQIIKIQKVFLEKSNKPTYTSMSYQSKYNLVWGVCIEFKNKNYSNVQKLYYFGIDLADGAWATKPELKNFIQSFSNKITFIKSASYLLHTGNFTKVRDFIVSDTQASIQDDTGVPYKYFNKAGWSVRLYGKYAKPIRDFNYGYQPDLAQKFAQDKDIKPINFTFGYHWWTDKSSIIIAEKPEKK
jgi:hypothetical protein